MVADNLVGLPHTNFTQNDTIRTLISKLMEYRPSSPYTKQFGVEDFSMSKFLVWSKFRKKPLY